MMKGREETCRGMTLEGVPAPTNGRCSWQKMMYEVGARFTFSPFAFTFACENEKRGGGGGYVKNRTGPTVNAQQGSNGEVNGREQMFAGVLPTNTGEW